MSVLPKWLSASSTYELLRFKGTEESTTPAISHTASQTNKLTWGWWVNNVWVKASVRLGWTQTRPTNNTEFQIAYCHGHRFFVFSEKPDKNDLGHYFKMMSIWKLKLSDKVTWVVQLHPSVWELVVSCHEVDKEVLIKDSLDKKQSWDLIMIQSEIKLRGHWKNKLCKTICFGCNNASRV